MMHLLPSMWLLLLSAPSYSTAQQPSQLQLSKPLNVHQASLSALTSPGSYYFLEFPITPSSTSSQPQPRCEDGSSFSFLFKRGTDENLSKLLVEFDSGTTTAAAGANAANADSSTPIPTTSTPWYNAQLLGLLRGFSLPLGSCSGIPQGFVNMGADLLGFDTSAVNASATSTSSGGSGGGGALDLPIFLREQGQQSKSENVWWEELGGDYSSVHDWSYLFVPYCGASFADANTQGVLDWVTAQFETVGGLDALVTVGGGQIGGCGGDAMTSSSSALAPLLFAKDAAKNQLMNSASSAALAIMDGATLWNMNNNGATAATMNEVVEDALSTNGVEVAWVSSASPSWDEAAFLINTKRSFGSFHIHAPSSSSDEDEDEKRVEESCLRYAFSDESVNDDARFVSFVRDVVQKMPWSTNEAKDDNVNSNSNDSDDSSSEGGERLSFLSIFLIFFGLYLASWLVYLLIKHNRQRQQSRQSQSVKASTPSPHDLWFLALTKYPTIFLLVSILIPSVLSYVAYAREGYTVKVNMDFDSYLDIDTTEERRTKQYKSLLSYQKESLLEEQANCEVLHREDGDDFFSDKRSRTLMNEAMEEEVFDFDDHHRGLQAQTRSVTALLYQNRKGGTVFTPEVLGSIRDFEQSLAALPGYRDVCYISGGGNCMPFSSIMPYFYPDGSNLVDDIEGTLRTLSGSKLLVAKLDKYFSPDNLASNITATTVRLRGTDGPIGSEVRQFLESLHHELWSIDQDEKYPDLLISWSNNYMREVEAADALTNDFKWSIAALCFIGLMVFLKVWNVFLVFAGVLGLILSFTSALYWQIHFNFNELTAMHVAGIFVMLGIGADDIFLMIDSFEHTRISHIATDDSGEEEGTKSQTPDDPEVIKERIISSYKIAGSMMLVSSVTTAICFFSNVFSAVVSIRDFGSYMGVVVVLNFIHVMTILPSAILVNELYIKPKMRRLFCSKSNDEDEGLREPSSSSAVVDGGARIVLSSAICDGSTQEADEEEGGKLPKSLASDTGLPPSSPCPKDALQEKCGNATTSETNASSNSDAQSQGNWQEHGRDATMSDTITSSDNENVHVQIGDDYKFLKHTQDMSTLDRYFVTRHAPTVYKRRKTILVTSIIVSIILGVLAWLNFTLYDGTIVVFKEKYNLGRVQKLVDEYYPEALVQRYSESDLDDLDESEIPLDNDIVIIGGTNDFGIDGSSVDRPAPSMGSPTAYPVSAPTGIQTSAPSMGSPTAYPISASTGIQTSAPSMGSPTAYPISAPTGIQTSLPSRSPLSQSSAGSDSIFSPQEVMDSDTDGNQGIATDSSGGDIGSPLSTPTVNNSASTLVQNPNAPSTTILTSAPIVSPITSPPVSSDQIIPESPPPTVRITPPPTAPPTKLSTPAPTPVRPSPTPKPVTSGPDFICPPGLPCLQANGASKTFTKREYFAVSIVWGMMPVRPDSSVLVIRDDSTDSKNAALGNTLNKNYVDTSDPHVQEWLLRIVSLSRDDKALRLHPQPVWIETLKDFAVNNGIGFPIPKESFVGVVDLLSAQSPPFRKLVAPEIATKKAGISGDFLFTSLSVLSEVPLSAGYTSEVALNEWSNFTRSINEMLPEDLPPIHVESSVFLDTLQMTAIVDSTLSSYFFANGLVMVIILLFTGNLALMLMIMASLVLILLCFGGLIFFVFRIEFGPVESLGVSIFVGLTANYLLHIAHAYHKSSIKERNVKIQRAVFVTGSPIAWSAMSTIGGSAFLFACRTWLLTELGILICTVVALSLLFSVGFLLAFLAFVGPLPVVSVDDKHPDIHSWDIMIIYHRIRGIMKGL